MSSANLSREKALLQYRTSMKTRRGRISISCRVNSFNVREKPRPGLVRRANSILALAAEAARAGELELADAGIYSALRLLAANQSASALRAVGRNAIGSLLRGPLQPFRQELAHRPLPGLFKKLRCAPCNR
jgi:hypothetical protein